jgi:hypothetical protein
MVVSYGIVRVVIRKIKVVTVKLEDGEGEKAIYTSMGERYF